MSAARSSTHWGAFSATVRDDGTFDVTPHPADEEPSALLANVPAAAGTRARVLRPHVRRGWWEDGPGPDPRRGDDVWLAVGWEEVLDRLAVEFRRVLDLHGPAGIFGGSYGWGSAGRFHHAQSQVHRFHNALGGSTRSVTTYSHGAAEVLLPRVLGDLSLLEDPTSWSVVEEHTDLLVCFGGLPAKNSAVSHGGATRHPVRGHLRRARRRGARFVLVSPLRDDLDGELGGDWLAPVPGTDTALVLALCQVLVAEDLHDVDFLRRCCTGTEQFLASLEGADDGVAKTPEWAEAITGVPAATVRALARDMAASRTLLTVSWSLQRAPFGEQPLWAAIALAALLGQIGLPGGGIGHGYSSTGGVGSPMRRHALPTLPQGRNPVRERIPVARIADALLHPGEEYDFDGSRRRYPDLRLVHWTGGNPFHHHQDLARLRRAFQRPDTVLVQDPFWTATARHADVVLPSTTPLEREDLGAARYDDHLHAMDRVLEPVGEARDDYDVLAALAQRLGAEEAFTEGRTSAQWVAHLYESWRAGPAVRAGVAAPPYAQFRRAGSLRLPPADPVVLHAGFRADPGRFRLRTPSGRIELHSATIASFGYDDCPGHPVWREPEEWLGSPVAARFPLHLVANNPATRLHSQLDHGAASAASKVRGREPLRMHPDDARERGLADGDVVVVRSRRGSCLAGLVVSADLRPRVVQMSTGAWFDPVAGAAAGVTCGHGNVNVLTADVGTSRLGQGCTGQHALVEVEAFRGALPAVTVHDAPVPAASSSPMAHPS
ncbi:biotin/methionine sulfoxide reductase [Kineococcus xinjiangensis]|uniref:Biotin/methionine sulfoxide reductase n=1 Tax=Kineococcus xinjiangensis TaxID=512762 RepID=A0A2S6IVF3_9ACTN|nr:molybdopterin-dependent oxidoreductase [Kineococcus xinjiangensis]PPK98216.1 biotin/methionine sulfoxide reductase [Kineococcus xinjiangensis]